MNLIVGVSAGIAIYKVVDLVRKFIKRGDSVKVVMTNHATKFISPELFKEISQNEVMTDIFENEETAAHIKIVDWCDAMIIAPATANIIGKIACGIADDSLSTVAIALNRPLIIAPAMNTHMYLNPAMQNNLKILESRGIKIIEPDSGELACGTSGIGRLPEPDEIILNADEFLKNFRKNSELDGKKIIVTAGGTREPIDPVRFIGNHSSGKMGHAIANALSNRGAEVVLITSSDLEVSKNIRVIKIETAEQMRQKILSEFENSSAVIMSAAVADYRVKNFSEQKIKKFDDNLTLELVKNPDILFELGQLKKNQILIGFAAETQDFERNAREKLIRKNLDMIVANDVTAEGAGFGVDTNIVTLITKDNLKRYPIMKKSEVAELIADYASKTLGTLK